jgi:CRISPR-associated protein Cas2
VVVIVLEKVPPSLRGHLTRWMLEVSSGVFVGRLSALVRDLLWEKCQDKAAGGRGTLMYRTNTEQGFILKMFGDSKRSVMDYDGLQLVAVRNAQWEHGMAELEQRRTRALEKQAEKETAQQAERAARREESASEE